MVKIDASIAAGRLDVLDCINVSTDGRTVAVDVSVLTTHPPNQITVMEIEMKQSNSSFPSPLMHQTSLNANLLMRNMQRMDCHCKRRSALSRVGYKHG
jgi:hypothetical protein